MQTQKYSVNQHLIGTLMAWVVSGEIAIPEIQRPFVWDSTKVRDLMDSLYKGFPVGYIIAWRNPNVRLKDGKLSEGKKVLIDGQQRVTALTAALLGQKVVNTDYKKVRIQIAFHPVEERFEVFNTAIQRDPAWIPDIAPIINGTIWYRELVNSYCDNNPGADIRRVDMAIANLIDITKKQVGIIELDAHLDIETVTEIFIRINSKGVVLSQADFAMSKIASNETYGGPALRKCIDYFCHLAVKPEFYGQLAEGDTEFAMTEYLQKIAWLARENDDLYDPNYSDLLRVAFTSEFSRGKLSDLVSLLSGRNFETRTFEDEIAANSFERLKQGVLRFVNETNFQRFLMIIKSAGFIDRKLIRSQNALNFAYIIYLKLRAEGAEPGAIEGHVRKWFVLSMLTGRYSASPETSFDYDIKNISKDTIAEYLRQIESAELSAAFWNVRLPQQLNTSSASSPSFYVYLASQCRSGTKGFLSKEITVRSMIEHKGDIHHIFPKDYLKKLGATPSQYNQVANYVSMQSEINVRIGNKAPKFYFGELWEQCETGVAKHGSICDPEELRANLAANDIPEEIHEMDAEEYGRFLELRRGLMAARMREYYEGL